MIRDCCLFCVAILCPPIAVCLHQNDCCTWHVLLNLLLTIVGLYIGGIIHAFYVICCLPDHHQVVRYQQPVLVVN